MPQYNEEGFELDDFHVIIRNGEPMSILSYEPDLTGDPDAGEYTVHRITKTDFENLTNDVDYVWDNTSTSVRLKNDTELTEDRRAAMLAKRQNLLTMSDRYVLSDYPITDAKRTEWTTYRQALRDLPDNVTDAQILGGTIPWPTRPD